MTVYISGRTIGVPKESKSATKSWAPVGSDAKRIAAHEDDDNRTRRMLYRPTQRRRLVTSKRHRSHSPWLEREDMI